MDYVVPLLGNAIFDHLLDLEPQLRSRINGFSSARDQIADLRVVNIDFYPRESHLAIFRDPWSFPTLFHPGCNNLVRGHLEDLAAKVCLFA